MLQKTILIFIIFFCSSCTTYKVIRKKDFPEKNKSFVIMNLVSNQIGGNGYRYFTSKQFDSTVDWDFNSKTSDLIKNLFETNGFLNIKIYPNFNSIKDNTTILDLLKDIELQTKNVPDYYIMLIPRKAQDTIVYGRLGGSGELGLILLVPIVISAVINHNYVKYSDLEVSKDPIYKTQKEYSESNLKIISFGGIGSKQSNCSVGYDLLLIDRKKNQLIAFNNSSAIKKLSNYYEWTKFDSFSSFTSEEKSEIKKECFQVVDKRIEGSLKDIGIIK